MGNEGYKKFNRREKIIKETKEILKLEKKNYMNAFENFSNEKEIEENPISSLFTPHKIIMKAINSIESEIIKKK